MISQPDLFEPDRCKPTGFLTENLTAKYNRKYNSMTRDLSLTAFQTTSLESLIDALEHAPPQADVMFDFCYLRPTKLDSYRGYYDHLALGWSNESVGDRHWPSCENVLYELRAAIYKSFCGWKGGRYRMTPLTPVWVANPGESGGTGIVAVDIEGSYVEGIRGTVTLITKKVDA